jgi:diguanylate cyclase (GGDEF)-like protein/PAS domain S-box-containing protein
MSAVFTNSAYLLSGVSAYAFLTHIQVGLRKPRAFKHILFSFICLCITIGSPFNAIINSANSVPEYIFATKIGYTLVILFVIFFSWFIPFFTGKRPVYFLIATSLFFVLMLILNIFRPYGFQYDQISNLRLIELPWGESYTLAVGKISLIYKISVSVFLILMTYLIYSLSYHVYRNRSKSNISIFLATIFLVSTYLEAILVRSGVINFLPLGTFGGLGLIIVMSVILNKEHNDERNNAAIAIIKEHKKLETILKTANDGIYVLNMNGLLVQANDAFLSMLRLDKSSIGQLKLSDWNATLENVDLKQRIQTVLKTDEKIVAETQHRRSDGKILDVEVSFNAVDIDGDRFLFCASRDITERKRLQKELEQRAHIDYLTKVNNRGYFMLLAEQELLRAIRYDRKVSLFMLDIDHFKKINDMHGHKSGDIALQRLAEICRNALREVDIIGRIGGEEFAILLPETDKSVAYNLAERLRTNIAKTEVKILSDLSIYLTVSIGVSVLSANGKSIDVLLQMADKALYEAKNSGRNKVAIYKE